MPLYRATSFKRLVAGSQSWSNVYTVNGLDAFGALEALDLIRAAEQAVHYDTIQLYRGHVINLADKTDNRTTSTALTGALDPTGLGGPLPLFCTMRCVFTDQASKPEQKYLRLGAQEDNLTLGLWDGEFRTFVQDNYVTPLLDITQFVGPHGEHPIDGTAMFEVQNRQLGWHRRSRPGFHRGWVPD